jgi:hypothetical protein
LPSGCKAAPSLSQAKQHNGYVGRERSFCITGFVIPCQQIIWMLLCRHWEMQAVTPSFISSAEEGKLVFWDDRD